MVEKYRIFELELNVENQHWGDIPEIIGIFEHNNKIYRTKGFCAGKHRYKVRFSPDEEGVWNYRVEMPEGAGEKTEGSFKCVASLEENHGMVKRKSMDIHKETEDIYRFQYADGTGYMPFGTTCYAWIYQSEKEREETLTCLEHSPFNKIRMCVFPKHYVYNLEEPCRVPFLKENAKVDFEHFDYEFFDELEEEIRRLDDLGIEADVILFHPYDRWGFSTMTAAQDRRYLTYIVRRLCHFKNIWWSLANEYDLLHEKNLEDWEDFADIIMENDPYGHLRSIHNNIILYDYNRPWITHCSIQRVDVYKTAEMITDWRREYRKPVVVDECGYEGNMDYGWGNLTGQELTRRFWEGYMRGGYLSHGECFVDRGDKIWWSHGVKMYGSSVERIDFLRGIIEELPGDVIPIELTEENHEEFWDCTCLHQGEKLYLYYLGFSKPLYRNILLSEDRAYRIELIDTWNMTRELLPGVYSGKVRIRIGERQYMAIKITEVEKAKKN